MRSRPTRHEGVWHPRGFLREPGQTGHHFYVIQPNSTLIIAGGVLRLRSREASERPYKPINILFRSLPTEHGHRAVAVVLSGTGDDGAQALEQINAAGGITMAQKPTSAKFDGMPKSAIATGSVDLVLPPKELDKDMVRIGQHQYLNSSNPPDALSQEGRLKPIFELLQGRSGTDFSRYAGRFNAGWPDAWPCTTFRDPSQTTQPSSRAAPESNL